VSGTTGGADPYFDLLILIYSMCCSLHLTISSTFATSFRLPSGYQALNLVVIGAILFLKRLHLQRNFTWIGIGLSNIIILASHLMADLIVRFGSSASTRALSIWLFAPSTANQTVNIFFAHLERDMCIDHPKWHKILFTATSIIVVQLSSFVLLFLVLGLTNISILKDLFLNQLFSSCSWGSRFFIYT